MTTKLQTFHELCELSEIDALRDVDIKNWLEGLAECHVTEQPSVAGVVQFWVILPNHDLVTVNVSHASLERNRVEYTQRVKADKTDPKNKPIGYAPQREFDIVGSPLSVYFGNRCNAAILRALRYVAN